MTSSAGQALKTTKHVYSTVNGREIYTQSKNTDGSISQQISRLYDTVGNLVSYTDANGNISIRTYDVNGRLASKSTDLGVPGTAVTTYGYDAATGDLTSETDSMAGTFAVGYNQDGQPLSEAEPNGFVKSFVYNEAGQPVQKSYAKTTGCSSNCTWYQDVAEYGAEGRMVSETGSTAQHAYSYDSIGRLSQDQNANWGPCTTTSYAYDANSNRTQETTIPPGSGGACSSSGGTSKSHTYDQADRLTDSGYTYDAFGRTTTVPASDAGGQTLTASYYVNDLPYSVTQNGNSSYMLRDPMLRVSERVMTGNPSHDLMYAFSDDSDSPSMYRQDGNWTERFIAGPDGDNDVLDAHLNDGSHWVVVTFDNIRGDEISAADATGSYFDATVDAFGAPRNPVSDMFHYGFLGSKQRESITTTGVVSMGERLYLPQVGRFLQVDPVFGGSANTYDYANQDPVNNRDLDGRTCAFSEAELLPSTTTVDGVLPLNAKVKVTCGRQVREINISLRITGGNLDGIFPVVPGSPIPKQCHDRSRCTARAHAHVDGVNCPVSGPLTVHAFATGSYINKKGKRHKISPSHFTFHVPVTCE